MSPEAATPWLPYCGAAPLPEDWLGRWNFDSALLAALAGITILLWRTSEESGRRLLGGALALALLLFVSPFCALSSALFSARVIHHVLIAAILAPLLVFALPERRTRWQGSLALWTGLQAVTFWLWHAPGVYAAALSSDLLYWTMQISLLGTAAGFWAALRRSSAPAAIAVLLVSTVQMGLLGALITFAATPLYRPHLLTTQPWGLSALEDQQLAGLIMWAPSAGLYLAAALFLVHRWLAREERELAT
ncbi:MAG: cytochrome c oxidase assembly protein [Pseudomonadota bacterium]|nr:cytochrome c oxidase assembly protein [Pseudomonadota bacterium]